MQTPMKQRCSLNPCGLAEKSSYLLLYKFSFMYVRIYVYGSTPEIFKHQETPVQSLKQARFFCLDVT
jgi:hypothetical protein